MQDTDTRSTAGLIILAVDGINMHEITPYILITAPLVQNRMVHIALHDLHAVLSAMAILRSISQHNNSRAEEMVPSWVQCSWLMSLHT
jgi:hypothetical protein